MRYSTVVIAAAAATALAKPHGHAHHHAAVAKRADAAVYVPGPVETVVIYELNGHSISEEDVRNGIANGTLTWGEDGSLSSSAAVAPTPPPPAKTQAVEINHVAQEPQPVEQSEPEPPASISEPMEQPSENVQAPDPMSYHPVGDDGSCPDCDKDFPNRKFNCSEFPAGYGAFHLGNEGLGGWSGIQAPAKRDVAGYHDIMTVPTGSCPGGECCSKGRFCSYACPNPYLKMSFPKLQGARKESVGGLFCNQDGKLEMADGSLSKTLCGKGSSRVKVMVQSKLSKPVSLCRTDYPGTESETLPLTINSGETKELANPDQKSYYFWDNKPTSAQYYVNNQGVSEAQACTWGSGQGDTGNRAPVNIGTSFDDILSNMGYTGLLQNKPTNPDAKLNFVIRFMGDGVSNPCSYKDGQYYNADGVGNPDGCTASIADGKTLTIVFTDN
ncbi:Protein BZZ1 [Didymosphaeria variabile]|uniref:Protein BZZ1 n=1 Tax=Didymosphaeria variabile TaxID=1932322 RepID=A0A9W8XIN5_9PLEO|nr:Protein BZZ1 [Didymosphaeria variabile]KAJ4351637.1 Protein BZZ1 [Didymosphaeria variabile]